MDKINMAVQIAVKVNGGLMVSKLIDMDVEAFSEIKGTVPVKVDDANPGEVIIAVHPMDDASEVQLLLLTRDSEFDEATDKDNLKYFSSKEDGSAFAPAAKEYNLNGDLHLFTGNMIQAALEADADKPHYLKFTNATDKEAMIRILVGRSASPT